MKTAVIDLGSNSLRMGIYEKREGRLALVKQYRFSTRLAEGLSQDNCLQPLPMKRTVEAFCKLKEILVENKIVLFRAVATESLRRACNSEAFLIQVRQESGIVIEVRRRNPLWIVRSSMYNQCGKFLYDGYWRRKL